MSLEKDIHQKKFTTEKQKVFVNLLYTYHHLVSKISTVFKSFDITRQQYNVLRILRGQHPKAASINLIKERMLDKMSDASRIVERLRRKGFIERSQCETDRRAVEVVISAKGLNTLSEIDALVEEFEQKEISLSTSDAQMINSLLDKLRGSE